MTIVERRGRRQRRRDPRDAASAATASGRPGTMMTEATIAHSTAHRVRHRPGGRARWSEAADAATAAPALGRRHGLRRAPLAAARAGRRSTAPDLSAKSEGAVEWPCAGAGDWATCARVPSSGPSRGRGRAGPTGTGGRSPPSSRSSLRAPSARPGSSQRIPSPANMIRGSGVRTSGRSPPTARCPTSGQSARDQPLLVDDVRRVELGVQVAQPVAQLGPERALVGAVGQRVRVHLDDAAVPAPRPPPRSRLELVHAETLSSGPKPLVREERRRPLAQRSVEPQPPDRERRGGLTGRRRIRHASSPSQGESATSRCNGVWSVASTTASASTADAVLEPHGQGAAAVLQRRRGHRHAHPHPEGRPGAAPSGAHRAPCRSRRRARRRAAPRPMPGSRCGTSRRARPRRSPAGPRRTSARTPRARDALPRQGSGARSRTSAALRPA